MRWVPLCALLLLAAWPARAQDGCDPGIEEDSAPTGPEEPEPEKPAPKPEPRPEPEPKEGEEPEDDATPPTAEEINRAIDRGVAWLKAAQKETGSWGPCVSGRHYGQDSGGGPCYHLGPTAFSVFTLATCGVPRGDPAIRKGLAWVEKTGKGAYRYTSYESAAVILMLTAVNGTAPPAAGKRLPRSGGPKGGFRPDDWNLMEARIRHLLENLQDQGGFGYWVRKPGYADVSATQFAILALRQASFAGYPVEKIQADVWTRTATYLDGLRARSGGFPYHNPHAPSPGMTAAALSSLLICREQIGLMRKEKKPAWLDESIEKGLGYLDANFDVTQNPSPHDEGGNQNHYHYCHLYAIERTGILSGRRELGGKDWYLRGAAWLVAGQRADGSWDDDTCMNPEDVLGTCFALLFLTRATPPAVTVSGD
jgi:hypothetical protein